MFPQRFWPDRMFAPRYWPKVGATIAIGGVDGEVTIHSAVGGVITIRALVDGTVTIHSAVGGVITIRALVDGTVSVSSAVQGNLEV